MGKKQRTSSKPIDIAKEGALNWRVLQQQNNYMYDTPESLGLPSVGEFIPMPTWVHTYEGEEQSPLMQQTTRLGNRDYLGNSIWDPQEVSTDQLEHLSDIRAENQPWYSKLVNGVGKAGVLAVTTALETAGLLYGAGHSILEATGAIEDNGKSWLQDLWDNPITNALQSFNEASEEYMPNYYTQDEQENPWGHIFSANFLGDKLLKNLGFMVGAFYGGMPASAGIGKLGTMGVKAARNATAARAGGMARRFGELTADYSDDVLGKVGRYGREIAGLPDETAASIGAKYGDDVTGLYRKLAKEGLTEGERGQKMLEGLDKINSIANATRATTQTIGVIGSAINEGAIEALNNSNDWAEMRTREENDAYQQGLAEIDARYGGVETPEAIEEKMALAQDHEKKLAAIEKGRAEVGNADLLMNLPILLASNAYQLGRLYTRGFDTTSRGMTHFGKNLNSTRREMGSFWNGHKLSGSLKEGTLASDKKTWKGVLSALSKSNTEGMEELTQKMAQDAAGNAVDNAIARYMSAGNSEEAKTNVDDYIAGMGKAIADNLQDPKAWEEYMIGAVSSMVGMPVFGSQTKNAYLGKGKLIGLQGGFFGNLNEYKDAMKRENDVANYLNKRVKEPEFKAYYDNLKKHFDYDKWMEEVIVDENGKLRFKDLELENFYQDINMAASSGHLEEFKQLVGYNQDYTDAELADIVKLTSKEVSPEQQRKADEDRKAYLEGAIQTATKNNEEALVEDFSKELEEVNKRLQDDESGEKKYEKKLEGPFIDRNGQMNVTAPDKMREILERNRQNLLQGIDDYLKIRNDIDIETDGRLTDEQIATLTMMRGHILDYEKRSAEMAYDIASTLSPVKYLKERIKKITEEQTKEAKTKYENAKKHWEAVEKGKHSDDWKDKVKKEYEAAEKEYNNQKKALGQMEAAISLLEMITGQKDMGFWESRAYKKGYETKNSETGEETKLPDDERNARYVNTDEAQNILKHLGNAWALQFVASHDSGLTDQERDRVLREIDDMHILANMKQIYNRKVREFMGDPSLINETAKQVQDKLSKQEMDNKIQKSALSLQKVKNIRQLDDQMKEIANTLGVEAAKEVLNKAKQGGDENFKQFIKDYESGLEFLYSVRDQISKLPEELNGEGVRQGVGDTVIEAWERALSATNTNSLTQAFREELGNAMSAVKEAGAEETAKSLEKIISDLDAIRSTTSTNDSAKSVTNSSSSEAKDDEKPSSGKGEGGDPETIKKRKEYTNKLSNATDMEELEKLMQEAKDAGVGDMKKVKDAYNNRKAHFESLKNGTPDSIKEAIEKEAQEWVNTDKKISEFDLSNSLEERIIAYNKAHEDAPIDAASIARAAIQKALDDRLHSEQTGLNSDDSNPDNGVIFGEKAQEMSQNTKTSFKSDAVTRYLIDATDYKLEYHGENQDGEQVKEVKELIDFLEETKAFDFVDRNYLGYIARADEESNGYLEVRFVKSTRRGMHDHVFLAVKIDNAARKAIKDKFGEDYESPYMKTYKIGDDDYQIIGCLSINKDQVAPEVKEAFGNIMAKMSVDIKTGVLKQVREEGKEFVMHETLKTYIDTLYTGRLAKRSNAKDLNPEKISLLDFVSMSDEWKHRGERHPFHFGVVLADGNIRKDEDSENDYAHQPDNWKKNSGSVVIYVPRPDGRYYPLTVTKRTVGEWLSKQVDGVHTGEEMLKGILIPEGEEGHISNEYLENIVNYLKTILNSESADNDRWQAKNMLARYIYFGNVWKEGTPHPIHVDENTGDVTVTIGEERVSFKEATEDNMNDMVIKMFDLFSRHNLKFTLPTVTREEIDSNDIIMSGVFEIGLKDFYNYNANFTLRAIDENGNELGAVTPVGTDPLRQWDEKNSLFDIDLGKGERRYVIMDDNTVVYADKKHNEDIPTDEEANLILLLKSAQESDELSIIYTAGILPEKASAEYKQGLIVSLGRFKDVKRVDYGDDVYIYDPTEGDVKKKLKKYKKEDVGKSKIIKDLQKAVSKYGEQHAKEAMKGKGASIVSSAPKNAEETAGLQQEKGDRLFASQSASKTIFNTSTVENKQGAKILSDGMLIADKAGDASTYTTGTVNGKKVFYPSAPLAVVRTSANQQSFFVRDKSTATATEAGGYVVYEPGEYEERKGAIVVTKKAKIGYYKNSPDELVGNAAGTDTGTMPEGKKGKGKDSSPAEGSPSGYQSVLQDKNFKDIDEGNTPLFRALKAAGKKYFTRLKKEEAGGVNIAGNIQKVTDALNEIGKLISGDHPDLETAEKTWAELIKEINCKGA